MPISLAFLRTGHIGILADRAKCGSKVTFIIGHILLESKTTYLYRENIDR